MQGITSNLLFVLMIVVLLSTFSSSLIQVPVSSCSVLNDDNKEYVLTKNLTSSSTCIKIDADNVVLNGDGFTLTGNNKREESGVYVKSNSNIEIKNIEINNFYTGIEVESSSDIEVKNVEIHNSKNAVHFTAVTSSLINEINAQSSNIGVLLTTSSNNKILNSLMENNEVGIKLAVSSDNIVKNNKIMHNTNYGILLDSSSYNRIINDILDDNKKGIKMEQSLNNIVSDTSIINSITDVLLEDSSTGNTFLNSSYEISKEEVEPSSKLIRKWYADVKIIDSNLNPINEATAKAWNGKGDLIFNQLTNSNGLIERQELVDYINNGRRRISYSPYFFFGFKPSYTQATSSTLLTNNLLIILRLDLLNPPINPIISNITTNPELPFVNDGKKEVIKVNFNVRDFPINISFKLHDSQTNLILENSIVNITNSTQLPIDFIIPDNLNNGEYTIIINVKEQDGTESSFNIGKFFVSQLAEPLPSIEDITTNPSLPLTTSSGGEKITIDFTIAVPINVTLLLYDSQGNLINTQGNISINDNSNLPISYIVPTSLSPGTYTLNMTAEDSQGNINSIILGDIIFSSPQQQVSSSEGGGGGGGGGGGELNIIRLPLQNNTNITIPLNATNLTENNMSILNLTTPNETSGISFLTGAVIGAFKERPMVYIIAFIILLGAAAWFVYLRNSNKALEKATKK